MPLAVRYYLEQFDDKQDKFIQINNDEDLSIAESFNYENPFNGSELLRTMRYVFEHVDERAQFRVTPAYRKV